MSTRFSTARLLLLVSLCAMTVPAVQADLLPDLFKKTPIEREIWKEGEQYVGLAVQDTGAAPNQHPAELDVGEVRDALRSLDGVGFVRRGSTPVFTQGQAETLGRYLSEALARAKPNQDALFVVRGYGSIALDTLKEREWTSGRAFFVDGKLNLIIGSFKVKKDRGKRNAEASYGVLNDYSDLYFDTGSRGERSAKMPGRVVSTIGVSFAGGEGGGRPDWIILDVAKAAVAYREGLIPEDEKKRETKARQEAAKLTIERRQMREEMARLRQELKELKSGGGASASSVAARSPVSTRISSNWKGSSTLSMRTAACLSSGCFEKGSKSPAINSLIPAEPSTLRPQCMATKAWPRRTSSEATARSTISPRRLDTFTSSPLCTWNMRRSAGCSSMRASSTWLYRRATLPVRLMPCHWSRRRPVVSRIG